jgi:glyoxylase I family protein
MNVLSLHHVNLMVRDVEEATTFYRDVLGLSERTDRPSRFGPGAWFDVGDRRLSIAEGKPGPATGNHFALVVEDIYAARDELERAFVPHHTRTDPLLQIILNDPSGNEVELRQPPSAYAALSGDQD